MNKLTKTSIQAESTAGLDDGWWASILAEDNKKIDNRPHSPGNELSIKKTKRPGDIKRRRKPFSVNWDFVKELYQQDEIIEMNVVGANKGGLLVEGKGIFGFIPRSHLINSMAISTSAQPTRTEYMSSCVGRNLLVKVIEYEPEENRVVFSERAALTEAGTRRKLFDQLVSGQIVSGVVTNLTQFGAFIDIGGVEGLVHISEISWGRVCHPGDYLQVGQTVDVVVLNVSPEKCHVALSIKRARPNPWETVLDHFAVNDVFPAQISTIVPFGYFARLDDDLEGLLHNSEIPNTTHSTAQSFSTGQNILVRILEIDPIRQRISLSMKLEKDY